MNGRNLESILKINNNNYTGNNNFEDFKFKEESLNVSLYYE